MKPVTSNPYTGASFAALARACGKFARELEEQRVRSRAEREQMAADLRFLLIVMASRFDYGVTVPGAPELGITRAFDPDFASRYELFHAETVERYIRDHRRYTVQRAADFALGDRAHAWLCPGTTCLPHFPVRRAAESDDDMRECLADLEALFLAKRRPLHAPPAAAVAG
jgi:hypothetical protein